MPDSAPVPPMPWPSRVLAFETACALEAAKHEGAVLAVADAYAKSKQ
jgi:hypothetical protein